MKRLLCTLCLLLATAPAFAEQVIKRDEAAAQLTLTLQDALKAREDGFQADGVSLSQDLKLPDGAVTWSVELPGGTLQPGRATLPVSALVNGAPAFTSKANVIIRQKLLLPAVKENLPKGHVVTGDDLQWLEHVADRPIPNLVRDGTEVTGKESLRPIRPNTPLQTGWFSEPMAVNQGEKVRVILKKAGLSIETRAVAVTKGKVGDEIQVMNPESSRRYRVRITAPGEATVD